MTDNKTLLLGAATVALKTLESIQQWVERVDAAGGTTTISGMAECHAMLNSLRKNKDRVDKLVYAPLRAAVIALAEAPHE